MLVCDKHDRAITFMFCNDLHLRINFFGLLQKDVCLKEDEG